MAKEPKIPEAPQPSSAPNYPKVATSDSAIVRTPPQGAGVAPKPFNFGAPPRYVKYNVAVKVLADPVARNTFSQPYSGQRRFWGT